MSTLQVDPKADPLIYTKFKLFFNAKMDEKGALIPRVRVMGPRMKDALAARCREYGKGAVAEVIKKAAASTFLNGGNDRAWKADLTWLLRPNNFPKVLNGNYDDTQSIQTNGHTYSNRLAQRQAEDDEYDRQFEAHIYERLNQLYGDG